MDTKKLVVICMTGIILLYPFQSFARPRLEVAGIMSGEKPLAIVNETIVKEGDILNGVKVLEIREEFVRFEHRGKIFIKRIGEGCRGIKQPKYKQQSGKGKVNSKQEIEKKAFVKTYRDKLYRKALENYKLANDEYEIVNIARAYIYYEKAVKYAQGAMPFLPEAKRKEMAEIVFSFRERKGKLEGERVKIDNLKYESLKSPKEISGWLRSNVVYRVDEEVYGKKDYWQTPKETIILGSGDCEDFAFLAQALLKEIGIDSSVIAIQYSKGFEKKGHAICVFPKKGPYIYFSAHRLYKTEKREISDLIKSLYPEWINIDEFNLSGPSSRNFTRQRSWRIQDFSL